MDLPPLMADFAGEATWDAADTRCIKKIQCRVISGQ